MLYYGRTDVSETIYINKTSTSEESHICHYCFFFFFFGGGGGGPRQKGGNQELLGKLQGFLSINQSTIFQVIKTSTKPRCCVFAISILVLFKKI